LLLALTAALPAGAANYLSYGYGPRHEGVTQEKVALPMSLAWRFVTAPREYAGSAPVVVDTNVFYAAGYALYCLDVATGALKWAVMTKAPARSAPAFCAGLVWFGDDEGKLRAVSPETGKVAWEVDVGDAIRSPIVVSGRVLYMGTTGSKLVAVDAEQRKQLWQAATRDDVYAAPAVDERSVYVACLDNSLYAFDVNTGVERWRRGLPTGSGLCSAPVVGSNFIYVSMGKRLLVIGKYGGLVSEAAFKGELAGEPALTEKGLIVPVKGAGEAAVYALSERPFRAIWKAACAVSPSGPVTVTRDAILAGGSYGFTWAFAPDSGKMLWRYIARDPDSAAQNAEFRAQSAPVVANGRVYMVYDDGSLCCFSADAPDITAPSLTRLTPSPAEPVSAMPPVLIGANIYDEGTGVEPSSIKLLYDGKPVEWRIRLDNSDCYYQVKAESATTPVEDGWHTVTIEARDWRGNEIKRTWRFLADRSIASVTRVTPGTVAAAAAAVPTFSWGSSGPIDEF
jgi:outer membrane protein assembly factor BamB